MFLFIKILLTEFIAEMGDKTQLMLVALTSKFKLRDIILGRSLDRVHHSTARFAESILEDAVREDGIGLLMIKEPFSVLLAQVQLHCSGRAHQVEQRAGAHRAAHRHIDI